MSISTYVNGNKAFWHADLKIWQYEDGQSIDTVRKCPKCGELSIENDHCLGHLPGVLNACCGHGVKDGYIQFENGTVIRFVLKDIEHNDIKS